MVAWTFLFIAVCAVVVPTQCAASGVRPRILGPGRTEVAPNQFPWLVFILNKSTREYLTAGILIKPRVVLTLAYNYYSSELLPEDIEVVLGAHNRSMEENGTQTINVRNIVIHPEFTLEFDGVDLALIQLALPATLSHKIKIFPMRRINSDPSRDKKLARRGDCVSMGWGRIKDTLFETILPKTPQMYKPEMQTFRACANIGKENGFVVSSTLWLCSLNADKTETRPADGGNPLICSVNGGKLRLHGLVSWGNPSYEPTGLTGFIRLVYFRSWINENAKNLNSWWAGN